ncbi:MAG: L-arabinose isomerase [Trichococcus sp.]|jgi:L-arabinose isomerase|uniref:L-arabinose isomerase n=1 Tax=Trichococcus shcherbakoviae TaxID=2094020 RepID=A0A383TC84_9LACT|nr:L-arabinose isomerase [Trichococcus shcherbakoviae]MBP9593795.1 L-arabinose isomerase [Trichococcus sp.]HRG30537.1 L-arabinose isomerase [Trichococcus flocculiformis]MBP9976900.1 L-arabinose isomerase [Trichococcus sp.]SYZ77982.1 l-arabinose isomerase [Trichococcus shcherbakoviae]HRM18995.1 L-arabinose isomerase [Trichococcus flocculiformis]
MLEVGKKEFWFVVGSQHLYGEEALQTVKNNAAVIVESLNNSGKLPYPLVLQELAVTPDTITKIMKEVNYRDEVAGVITWMHTFSPAKMWIRGTKLLQKPLLHLATQFNESIPWATIDMDFMNLNQAAHGDREYGFINARLKKNNKVVVGYWERENVQTQIAEWMDVAVAYNESFSIKVARFGDNMRNVAVTEGDKVEAQIQFGWTVDYYGIRDLVDYVDAVADEEVDALFNEYKDLYDFDYGDYEQGKWEAHVKVQARQEIGIRRFLEAGGYTAFTSNFEDLHGLQQLPGLAVQRLMAEGYGFAGEGDWKTAAIDRLMKIMSHNIDTGFMEDYTYEMAEGREAILQSHMLEVDPGLAVNKPKILIAPLSMGNREEPARLVFDGKAGDGVVVSMADFGTHYKLLVNEVVAFEPTEAAPNLPVARVLWEVKPNFHDGIRAWIEAGGGHHTVVSLSLSTDQILAWAKLVGLEVALIK